MKLIGARLDRRVEHGSTRATELGTKVRGLNLEFLDGIHRRENDKIRPVEEVHRVEIVTDAVEHLVILPRPAAISRKGATGRIASSIRLRRVHAGRKLSEESK